MSVTRSELRDRLRVVPQPVFEELTAVWETETGYDSHATIERVYDYRDRSETYGCPVPGCTTRRQTARNMWMHVHLIHPPPDDALEILERLLVAAEEAAQ